MKVSLEFLVIALGAFSGIDWCKPPPEPSNAGGQPAPSASGSSTGEPNTVPTGAAVQCVPGNRAVLDLANIHQEHNFTCWAGVTRTIGKYMGTPQTECALVQRRKSDCTCAACPDSMKVLEGPCNNGGWPPFDAVGLEAKNKTVNEALPLETLKQEIACHKRPVAFTWNYGGSSGHIMVAYGYDGENIYVADPAPPCVEDEQKKIIAYAIYKDGEDGDGSGATHWDDFYGIEVMQ